MASVTIHVVQAFKQQEDGIVATEPKTCPSAGAARSLAGRLAQTHVGVIAWSRTASPNSATGNPRSNWSAPVQFPMNSRRAAARSRPRAVSAAASSILRT